MTSGQLQVYHSNRGLCSHRVYRFGGALLSSVLNGYFPSSIALSVFCRKVFSSSLLQPFSLSFETILKCVALGFTFTIANVKDPFSTPLMIYNLTYIAKAIFSTFSTSAFPFFVEASAERKKFKPLGKSFKTVRVAFSSTTATDLYKSPADHKNGKASLPM